ncbi:HNH endonuclease [Flavobacterium sp. MMLR14_040]|uniref:HNH endonuclease n=1 Tax=Flavobacterium sp. MMLR14_040 TaxID=3093843 RepID=UPI00298F4B74|nr:HNH endonuclease [Flavobacterium sp. MMLR14_040]MDW8848915.1 HNH endonuclease [Flavobacterium sp. MMLR14_040]
MLMYSCVYCQTLYPKNTEHVFPLGLGGEKIMIDCVCDKCNNEFSKLERELYQKSPVALIRSTEGVIGNKSRNSVSAFKASLLLCQDDASGIVYEVGQSERMQVFIRPQIIQIKNTFYVEADHQDNLNALMVKFKSWKYNNLRLISKLPESKLTETNYLEIEKTENNYFCKKIKGHLKIKNEIILDILPRSHHLHNSLNTRIYFDDLRNLKIRAKTETAAVKFILELLKFSDSKEMMNSYVSDTKNMKEVSVGFSFNSKKCEQALVKIALNTLFHYYPASRNQIPIQPYLDFVKTGKRTFSAGLEAKKWILDSQPNTHNIFLYQSESFLSIRISLFNGQFVYHFLIPSLQLIKPGKYSQFIVDYKLNKNQINNYIKI